MVAPVAQLDRASALRFADWCAGGLNNLQGNLWESSNTLMPKQSRSVGVCAETFVDLNVLLQGP